MIIHGFLIDNLFVYPDLTFQNQKDRSYHKITFKSQKAKIWAKVKSFDQFHKN